MRQVRLRFVEMLPPAYADLSLVVFGALGLMNGDLPTLRDLALRFGEFDEHKVRPARCADAYFGASWCRGRHAARAAAA